jgi:hypothetical protein
MWPFRSRQATHPRHELTTTIRRHRYVGKKGVQGNSGTGSAAFVPVPLEWRATTRQVCGLYPWASPGQLPMVGGPIGLHQKSGSVVCFDHISWFLAHHIGNPSVLLIAKPGLGKSALAKKMTLNLAAMGYVPIVPGDSKNEYSAMTAVVGGEVRTVSRSGGAALNPCDPGGMAGVARRIGGTAGEALMAEAIGRATVCISSLVELSRKGRSTTDYEESAVSAALSVLYAQDGPEPLLADLDQLLASRHPAVRAVLLDRGKNEVYDELIEPLRRSITALLGGQFGDVFARRVERLAGPPVAWSLDTSRIKAGDPRFLAAVLIAAWSDTYGMVEAQQALYEAGMGPRVLYCMVLDELWRVLNLGGTLPDRVNELTRLNRTDGIGQIMITHSIRDLARGGNSNVEGIEERAGAIMIGGAPRKELVALDQVVTLNNAERRAIQEWWSTSEALIERNEVPPGAGKFLLKASSETPGIPIQVVLSSVEKEWGGQNTNQAWQDAGDGRRRSNGSITPSMATPRVQVAIEQGDVETVAEEVAGGDEDLFAELEQQPR